MLSFKHPNSTPRLRFAPIRYQHDSAGEGSQSWRTSPNADILEMLHECRRQCLDGYKAYSFATAYNSVAALTTRLTGPDDARLRVMKGVGAGIRERVRRRLAGQSVTQILRAKFDEDALLAKEKKSKALRRKKIMESDDKDLLKEIKRVPGLGDVAALKLIEMGCESLEHLKQSSELQSILTDRQRNNVKYYQTVQSRVSRPEAECIRDFLERMLRNPAHEVSESGDHEQWQVHHVGDYRLGHEESSAIDLVVFHPNFHDTPHAPTLPPSYLLNWASGKGYPTSLADQSADQPSRTGRKNPAAGRRALPFWKKWSRYDEIISSPLLTKIIPAIRQHSLLLTGLTEDKEQTLRWRGIVNVPFELGWVMNPRYRQMDLTLAPYKSYGAAFLALTGDDEFLQHCTIAAARSGLLLNEYGLWKWEEGAEPPPVPKRRKQSKEPFTGQWVLMEEERLLTEQGLFDRIGIEWVVPEKRNFMNLNAYWRKRRETLRIVY
ncbi:Nucleotidyltransferase [Hymenopellis radicata]|nr:Nucleotidyltransferase [Hymenopellis radicata]